MTAIEPNSDGIYNVVFLGDSYMAGSDSTDGNGARKSVMDWLIINNESHNVRCVGSQSSTGIAGGFGWTTPLVHEGRPGWTAEQLTDLVAGGGLNYAQGKPNIAVIMAGANDFGAGLFPDQVYSNIDYLVDVTLAQQDNLVVVLGENVLMSSYKSATLTKRTRQAQELNEMLPGLVAGKGGRVVLARTSLLAQQDINSNGVHPTDTGYQKMAYVLYNSLRPWFGAQGKYLVPVKHPWYPGPDPLRLL